MFEFHAEMDARNQWKAVKGRAWDYANQQLFEAQTSAASFSEHGNIDASELADVISPAELELQHSGRIDQSELQAWVEAAMLKSRLSKIQGSAHILVGNAEIKPGQTVDLQGVGERFNGIAYVTGKTKGQKKRARAKLFPILENNVV